VYQSQQDKQLGRVSIEQYETAHGLSANLLTAFTEGDDRPLLNRALCALQRGPIRYPRDNVIVCEGDPTDYMFLVVSGTVRSDLPNRNPQHHCVLSPWRVARLDQYRKTLAFRRSGY
jgi:CRP-like cAMP-binding protein